METKMFCALGQEGADMLKNGNFTFNDHKYSIQPEKFESDPALQETWQVTSTSYDPDTDQDFVASIEGKKYPFMATQFHPEKVTQAWNDNYGINHSWESMELNTYFAK